MNGSAATSRSATATCAARSACRAIGWAVTGTGCACRKRLSAISRRSATSPAYINNTAFFIGFALFAAIAVGALLIGGWRGVIEWRKALLPALLVGGISLLSGLNTLPLYKAGYSTTDNYVLFWLGNIAGILLDALYNFVFVAMLWLGGTYRRQAALAAPGQDSAARRSLADAVAVWLARPDAGRRIVWLRGIVLRSSRCASSTAGRRSIRRAVMRWRRRFRFWGRWRSASFRPPPKNYCFGSIGITAVLLALKKRWLALLIPGVLWAFAHTGYVTDPIILRGIELTIEAVILGLFFLRFGLFVTIMSHFVYNAGLTALPLLRSSDPYFVFSGLIVIAAMFVPIIPGAIIWLRRRAHPIALAVAAPQIDLATLGDVDRLTALAIQDTDWPTWLNDPAVVVVCARSQSRNRRRGRGKDRRRRHDQDPHHLCRSSLAAAVPRQRIDRSPGERPARARRAIRAGHRSNRATIAALASLPARAGGSACASTADRCCRRRRSPKAGAMSCAGGSNG